MREHEDGYQTNENGGRVVAKAPRTPPARWLLVIAVIVVVGAVASRFFTDGGGEPAMRHAGVGLATTAEQTDVARVEGTDVAHSLRAREPLAASADAPLATRALIEN